MASSSTTTQRRNDLLHALSDVESGLNDNIERSIEMQRRVQLFRDQIEAGASIHETILAEPTPRAVEMLTANAAALETSGARFRARLAHTLRDEGLTIEAVADLFGVTRQRISALLRQG